MDTPVGSNVLDFATYATALRTEERASVRVLSEYDGKTSGNEVSLERLYPLADEINPQIVDASPILESALELITQSHLSFLAGDPIVADDYALRLRMLLPELFTFDQLGDGFRATILAVFHSLVNLEGIPLSSVQAEALKSALELVKEQPFISFDIVLDIHDEFQRVGLKPDPKALDVLGDALEAPTDEEQIAAGG